MFKRKIQCIRCGEKIEASFSFCPFCGSALRARERQERKERKQDPDNLLDALDSNFRMPFLLKFPFKKLVKEIEQQFKEMDKSLSEEQEKKTKRAKPSPSRPLPLQPFGGSGISISISGSSTGKPVIKVKRFGGMPGPGPGQETKEAKEKFMKKIPAKALTKAEQEKLKHFAALPRQEPETTVRRLTDRIVYEILLPGIKDKRNIMINRLQNSIEIKAFTKDKAYFKLIPLSLPIKRHYLEKEKLVLELKPQI